MRKMKCDQVKELLYRFIDGRTTAQDNTFIQEHLELCLECAREYQIERQVTEKLANGSLWEEAPNGLYETVRARLRTEKVGSRLFRILPAFFRLPALAAVTALLLLALGVTIYRTNGGMTTEGLIAHVVRDHQNVSAKGAAFLPVPVSTAKMAMEQIAGGRLTVAQSPGGEIEVIGGRFCAIGKKAKTPMIVYRVAGQDVSLHLFPETVRGLKNWEKVSTPVGPGYMVPVGQKGAKALLVERDGALSLLVSELPEDKLIHLASVLVKKV